MSRDKEYDEYCKRAGIDNRNYATTNTNTLGSATPTSPIRTALTLLDINLSNLQATTERLFSALKPVTTNTDDNHPGEPCAARQGNSSVSIDINAMADRLGDITAALQLQVDRLEV